MILGAFLSWSFNGDLISALLNQVLVLPFTDIQSLLKNTNYLISVIPGSTLEERFKSSKDVHDQLAYAERIKPFLKDFAKAYEGGSVYIHIKRPRAFGSGRFLVLQFFSQ